MKRSVHPTGSDGTDPGEGEKERREALQPSTMMTRIAGLALTAAEASVAHLELLDPESGDVEVIATAGKAVDAVGRYTRFSGSLAEEVLARDGPKLFEAEEVQRRSAASARDAPDRGLPALVLPLSADGTPLGALILLRSADLPPFASEDSSRLRAVAELAALAIARERSRRQVEARVRAVAESERRFRLLVTSVRDYAIFMLDPEGRIVSWNEGARRLKGYSWEDIAGRHFSIFYTEEAKARRHPETELTVAVEKGSYQEEGWRIRKDGGRFWAHVTITAVRDQEGDLLGFAKVTRDLTERRNAELERENLLQRERHARQEAERANHAKSDFLATMSHELRTPINAIIGYTELLDDGLVGPLTADQREYLNRVQASSRRLLSLVGDVLDVARIEAGGMDVHPRPVRVDEVIAAATALVQGRAESGGLSLQSTCSAEVMVEADPDRLQQVLTNLLDNAIKFTEEGGRIAISCEPLEEVPALGDLKGKGPWVEIKIEDTGIGIPSKSLDRIWEPFEQADSGHTRSRDGAGLGLTIVRSLTRLMRGDVSVVSEPGEGSCFVLHLPASTAEL